MSEGTAREMERGSALGAAVTGQGEWLQTESRLRLDIGKKFSTVRVVRHWHREAVDAPLLEMSKTKRDVAWSNLV